MTGPKLKKRLCLNLDGTGQAEVTLVADSTKRMPTTQSVSNVAKIGRATILDDETNGLQQIVYYQAGIGAETDRWPIQSKIETIGGVGLYENVREAYGFLANNYDVGDEIYLIGFSRGAFTARSVAGLMGRIGILTKKGLDKFYQAFDYYEYPNKYGANDCPVSEKDGETRIHYPPDHPNAGQRIKIKAIGVFDTVGALGKLAGDYGFHNVELGDHIENAFHALAIGDKRGHFRPTLWEVPGKKLGLDVFEQCWFVGDHSGVGGSWPDTQTADMALAWIMSKFEKLGLKFDARYLYDQYTNYKALVKLLKYKEGAPTNPRQWGEGQTRRSGLVSTYVMGGFLTINPYYPRTPVTSVTDKLLENTNETMHAGMRYRCFSEYANQLGTNDTGKFDPEGLLDFQKPYKNADGRIGAQGTPSKDGMVWTCATKKDAANSPLSITESILTPYEKLLLAIYDQDPDLKPRRIWPAVVGGKEPPPEYVKAVQTLRNPNFKGDGLASLGIQV